jgi:hypothetical protein
MLRFGIVGSFFSTERQLVELGSLNLATENRATGHGQRAENDRPSTEALEILTRFCA